MIFQFFGVRRAQGKPKTEILSKYTLGNPKGFHSEATMAPKDSSTRYHPYDPNKKPRIHRTTPSSNPNYNYARKQKKPPNSNDTTTITSSSQKSTTGLSVNDLKRRIRDVKRLLGHANLSPEARIVQERALAGYEKDLKEEQERRKRSEMIKKYHFVRFLGEFSFFFFFPALLKCYIYIVRHIFVIWLTCLALSRSENSH